MYSEELWNNLYIDYYNHNKWLPWMDDRCKVGEFKLVERIVSPLLEQASTGFTLLDYGCGNGHMGSLFSKKSVKVDLADISDVLIEKLKQVYGNDSNVSLFKTTTPDDLPEGKKYNVIIVRNVFHHLDPEQDWHLFLEMFSERLKSDGLLLITGWDKDDDIIKHEHNIACTGQKTWCINDLPLYIGNLPLEIELNRIKEIKDPSFIFIRRFRVFSFRKIE